MGYIMEFTGKKQPKGSFGFSTAYEEEKIREHLEGFYTIFPDIKRYINLLILQGKPINVIKKPSINIYDVAKKMGINIIEVSPEVIYYIVKEYTKKDNIEIPENSFSPKHAIILYEKALILLNKEANQKEKIFSIAHEIFHYAFWKELESFPFVAEKKGNWAEQLKKQNNINHFELKKNINQSKNYGIAARDDNKARRELIPILKKNSLELEAVILFITKTLKKDIEDIIEDEIADYFAANLVVPTERFLFWEDKTDTVIALAFKVPEKCIEKRREEIIHELEFMAPENPSSDVRLEEYALLS